MNKTNSANSAARAAGQTPDELNDAIRAQVDAEMPRPAGGFETDDQEQDWKDAQEARFMELVNAV